MDRLKRLASSTQPPTEGESTTSLRARIRETILTQSRTIQTPNFVRCHKNDLKLLFALYDDAFFHGEMARHTLSESGKPCALNFSRRLTSSGGITKRIRSKKLGLQYEIVISSNVLFHNFTKPAETAVVCGVPCTDRLDALMRIMEHELLHLGEYLAWGDSNCAAGRFQHLAAVLFGHATHKHAMVTPRQKAIAATTLRPGDQVQFHFDGAKLRGMVNRINQRATVLVESAKGVRYTNGKRYLKYYIPLGKLKRDGERATSSTPGPAGSNPPPQSGA